MAINNSIVDYLNSIGQDSSYAARKKLAAENGIQGYSGTANQNITLLKTLQSAQNSQANNSGVTAPSSQTESGVSKNVTAGVTTSDSSGFKKSDTTNNYQSKLQELESNKPASYQPSDTVNNYYDRLQDQETNKPAAYESAYEAEINSILDSILTNKAFDYTADDLANDDLYQMYRENYTRQGDLAMRDTMGNAAALTGGYGSTYATAAGQQAYDNYLAQLNDVALEFADRAYQKYLNEQSERYNQLSAVTALDDTAYGRYRDEVGDYYTDLEYLANRYEQEYAKDYGEYRDGVSDYNTELNYLANMYDTEYGHDMSEYQTDQSLKQWAEEFAFQKEQAAQEQANWEAEMALQRSKVSSGSGNSSTRSGSPESPDKLENLLNNRSSEYKNIVEKLTAWLNNGEMTDLEAYNQLMAYGNANKITTEEAMEILDMVGINVEAAKRQEALMTIDEEKKRNNGAFR